MICYFSLIIALSVARTSFCSEEISGKEKERKALNKKYDRLKLREKSDFVIDSSPDFLKAPKDKPASGEFNVAKSPPEIKMMILPDMEPEYFPPGPAYMTAWAI